MIDRYIDHLEFSNPGTLLLSRDQLLRGGVSECRNKSLQLMFQMLGAGDKAGSGIDKIRSSWAAEHWQSPRLVETFRPDRVQLILPMVSTLPDNVMKMLDARFGSRFRARTPDEIQALVAAEVEGGITNLRLQEMLSLHRVDITHMLRGLVRDGFLMSEGQGRGTRYLPAGADAPNSAGIPPNSAEIPPNSATTPPNSDGLPASASTDPDLLRLAEPVRVSGSTSREVVRDTILALCSQRFLTVRELATLLNRKPETIRDQYVKGMVREGTLVLKYPETPSHREQAYGTRHEVAGA